MKWIFNHHFLLGKVQNISGTVGEGLILLGEGSAPLGEGSALLGKGSALLREESALIIREEESALLGEGSFLSGEALALVVTGSAVDVEQFVPPQIPIFQMILKNLYAAGKVIMDQYCPDLCQLFTNLSDGSIPIHKAKESLEQLLGDRLWTNQTSFWKFRNHGYDDIDVALKLYRIHTSFVYI